MIISCDSKEDINESRTWIKSTGAYAPKILDIEHYIRTFLIDIYTNIQ